MALVAIKEKLEKEQKKLKGLLEQRKELDKKIEKAQDNVNKYDAMIKQKTYKETDEILSANNLTLDMINEAIKSGDLTSLQLLIEEAKKNKQEEDAADVNSVEDTLNE